MALADYPRVEISSRIEWREWLAANHGRPGGVWLVTWKKPDARHVPYEAVVEEALCFGWIDALPRKLDEARSMRLLAPRKAHSAWSKANKERVERLTVEGLMAPSGLAKVEDAKRSGLWAKLDSVEALEPPADLAEALAESPSARANWNAFPRSVRRGMLEWIAHAKRPETRARRVRETVEKAGLGERANQWRKR